MKDEVSLMNPYENIKTQRPTVYGSYNQLNVYQQAAVTDSHKVTLLNACVGSGKTMVILHKLLYLHLIQHIPLEKIVVMTFTNKAANEIRQRLKAFGLAGEDKVRFIGTFHAIAKVLMENHLPVEKLGYAKGFTVLDEDQHWKLFMDAVDEEEAILHWGDLDSDLKDIREGFPLISTSYERKLRHFLKIVKQRKKQQNLMSFDDLIDNVIRLLKHYKSRGYCKYVLVDEFQDSDESQLEFIKRLALDKANIFAVGDPNQTIYEWRGSIPEIFEAFAEETGAYRMSLPINYRSTGAILKAAHPFGDGEITGTRDEGISVNVRKAETEYEDAGYIADRVDSLVKEGSAYSDIAIFYRKNRTGEVFEEVFREKGIPFEVYVPGKGLELSDEDSVKLMSLHSSKGLEFKHVFITGVNEGLIPMTDEEGFYSEEEARLFYVGITRAKDTLELSWYESPCRSGYYVEDKPSRFLEGFGA